MNNQDLRTLAKRMENHNKILVTVDPDPSNRACEVLVLCEGVIRLLNENKRLSELLADEILDGSVSVPAEVRILDLPPTPPDVPDGFQEVIPNDED